MPSDGDQTPEIQKADPRARGKLITLLVIVVTIGLLSQLFLSRYLAVNEADLAGDISRLRSALYVLWLLTLPMLLCAFFMFRIGRRTVHAKRYPPPDTPVVKDTRVRLGSAAIRRGYAIAVLSIVLMLMVILIPLVLSLIVYWFLPAG